MDRAEALLYDLWVILGDLSIAPGATSEKKMKATECLRRALNEAEEEASRG